MNSIISVNGSLSFTGILINGSLTNRSKLMDNQVTSGAARDVGQGAIISAVEEIGRAHV